MAIMSQWRPYFTALLTLFLLGLTGCQSAERAGTQTSVIMDDDVVRLGDAVAANVNGTAIYQTDVERAAAGQDLIESGDPLLPTNEIYGQVLEELIDQRLLAQEALSRTLDKEDEAARRLAVARERILGNLLVEKHLSETVNEATVKDTYDEQKKLRGGTYELHASHILVTDMQTAYDIHAELEKDGDFKALAIKYSKDEATRNNGGDLGFFTQDRLDKNFTKAAFAVKDGEISEPFETQFGWHIVKAHERRKATHPSYGDIKDELITFMTYDEIQKLLKSLRAEATVKYQFGKDVPEGDQE